MKKKLLLLLLALIVVPAWAKDVAVKPAGTGVVIVLKGAAGDISALVVELEKEAVHKEALCSPASKHGKMAKIRCAKADAGLMAFLGQYASAKVQWHISGATTAAPLAAPAAAVVEAPVTATFAVQSTLVCKTGCIAMPCPATVKCCSTTTHQPCY